MRISRPARLCAAEGLQSPAFQEYKTQAKALAARKEHSQGLSIYCHSDDCCELQHFAPRNCEAQSCSTVQQQAALHAAAEEL